MLAKTPALVCVVGLDAEMVAKLAPHADQRGITVPDLIGRLLGCVADGCVDAVLDDEVKEASDPHQELRIVGKMPLSAAPTLPPRRAKPGPKPNRGSVSVEFCGHTVEMAPKVAELFEMLKRAAPHPVGREFLYQRIWPQSKTDSANAMLSGLTTQLREALAGSPLSVEVVVGVGLQLLAKE